MEVLTHKDELYDMTLANYLAKVTAKKLDAKRKIRRSKDKKSKDLKGIIANQTNCYIISIENRKG